MVQRAFIYKEIREALWWCYFRMMTHCRPCPSQSAFLSLLSLRCKVLSDWPSPTEMHVTECPTEVPLVWKRSQEKDSGHIPFKKMQDSGVDLDCLPILSDEDMSAMDGDFCEIRSKPLHEWWVAIFCEYTESFPTSFCLITTLLTFALIFCKQYQCIAHLSIRLYVHLPCISTLLSMNRERSNIAVFNIESCQCVDLERTACNLVYWLTDQTWVGVMTHSNLTMFCHASAWPPSVVLFA